ncbi:hypothetical protein TNCV_4068191 [Trichonephila clavipes]|nr:hypothetical protein TNCV_4068191 [Trichonephila clavipes]
MVLNYEVRHQRRSYRHIIRYGAPTLQRPQNLVHSNQCPSPKLLSGDNIFGTMCKQTWEIPNSETKVSMVILLSRMRSTSSSVVEEGCPVHRSSSMFV